MMELTEVLIEMDQAFSETQIIEFLEKVGMGGDYNITCFFKSKGYHEGQIEIIRQAIKMDSIKNQW